MQKPIIASIALALGIAIGASSPASAEQNARVRTTPAYTACPITSIFTFAERVVATLFSGTVEPCELSASTRASTPQTITGPTPPILAWLLRA